MIIDDKIYGKNVIDSPLVLELIQTKAFQRLKGISQLGIPDEYWMVKGYSRYEHSIGVYILLNKLNASLEEQIAGLLHDISHAAFSHVYDWVIGEGGNETFQDNIHEAKIGEREISSILGRYGYNPAQIANLHKYTLLDNEIPDLCVDRIDYALRELPSKPLIENVIPSLTVINENIVMTDKKVAEEFAVRFLKLQIENWSSYEGITRYSIFSQLLKDAIRKNVISHDDFWSIESVILDKIVKSGDERYMRALTLLKMKSIQHLPISAKPVFKKFRHIDPKILHNGEIIRLSVLSTAYSERLEEARRTNAAGCYVGVFPIESS